MTLTDKLSKTGIFRISEYLHSEKSITPLVTFRVAFGLIAAYGGIRFWLNGWIEKLFVKPEFFFKFYGFHWVKVPEGPWIYLLFAVIILSALGIALGVFFRLSAIVFFLSFTWYQLLDATNYLNHYYLVSLLAFLLIFLPANGKYSIDALRKPEIRRERIPAWCIHIIIFQLCCVYFFAGLAKVNSEWLLRAMPMAIWLPERSSLPVLGYFFKQEWLAYAFSWAGMIYDLSIWIFLLNRKTRRVAYVFVVIFHVLTKILFNIGLFPVIMIGSTLIFFSGKFHDRLWSYLWSFLPKTLGRKGSKQGTGENKPLVDRSLIPWFIGIYCMVQLLFPVRHHLYAGNVLWTEEAYRFGWRVMLVEKSGLATFTVKDSASDRQQEIVNGNYLTLYQEKQMSIQPDFILQFAHHLAQEHEEKYGFENAIVTVDAYVAINGRSSRRFIDPKTDLSKIKDTFAARKWVLAENF